MMENQIAIKYLCTYQFVEVVFSKI